MSKIKEIARQAALAKAREIIGDDVLDEREVYQLADAVAVAVLRRAKLVIGNALREDSEPSVALLDGLLAEFSPSSPSPQRQEGIEHAYRVGYRAGYIDGGGQGPQRLERLKEWEDGNWAAFNNRPAPPVEPSASVTPEPQTPVVNRLYSGPEPAALESPASVTPEPPSHTMRTQP